MEVTVGFASQKYRIANAKLSGTRILRAILAQVVFGLPTGVLQ
jgi:hypothetical protein